MRPTAKKKTASRDTVKALRAEVTRLNRLRAGLEKANAEGVARITKLILEADSLRAAKVRK